MIRRAKGSAMAEHAPRRARRRAFVPGHALDADHRIGEEALHFGRWFAQSKYRLMEGFLGALARDPRERDIARLRERYSRALTHAQRVLRARAVVTGLLFLGASAAAASAIGNMLLLGDALARVAAVAASLSVVLLLLRLAFDRYLARVDVTATFLAIELATVPRDPA